MLAGLRAAQVPALLRDCGKRTASIPTRRCSTVNSS